MKLPSNKVLCIVYSSGGIPDVARHAVQVALDSFSGQIRVLNINPQETLSPSNWNCACPDPHQINVHDDRLDLRVVDVTKDDLTEHLENVGAVISGLGNRQPYHGDRVGAAGTANLVRAMLHHQIPRLVMLTSAGCNEDWPPLEFHWTGSVLKWMFRSVSRREYQDLCAAEDAVRNHNHNDNHQKDTAAVGGGNDTIDYLIVRPVGLGEDRPPANTWFIQQKKHCDRLAPDMSKLDCARFCVQEAVEPTYHRQAVVIGADPENFTFDPKKATTNIKK